MGAQQEVRYEEGVQDGDIGAPERHMADKMAIPSDNIHFSLSPTRSGERREHGISGRKLSVGGF